MRAIVLMNQAYNSLVALRNSLADSKNNSVKIELWKKLHFLSVPLKIRPHMQTIAIASLLDL